MNRNRMAAIAAAGAILASVFGNLSGSTADVQENKIKVLPFGDSITDGFTVQGGYRTTLWNMLKEQGYTEYVDFVGPNWGGEGDPNHAGYSGYTIMNAGGRNGIYELTDRIMQDYQPDVVMLQIGTNDIIDSYELSSMGERLEQLVDKIYAYLPDDGMLYLATIPYMDADVTTYTDAYTVEEMDAAVDAYNEQVRALAVKISSEGKPIAVSEVNRELTKSDLSDGVHPSVSGYQKLGSFWYSQIHTYFDENKPEPPKRIMPLGDSITDGFTVQGGYRNTLWKLLEKDGKTGDVDFVGPNWGGEGDPNHAGYSGYAIMDCPGRSGIYNLIDSVMESYPADAVMLQIGTNDIISGYELPGMGERLELLVDKILGHLPQDGVLFLATIPYMDADVTTYTDAYTVEEMDAAVDVYNAQIRELVFRKQNDMKPVVLADVNAALTKQDLSDGVHPSVEGYAKLGTFWHTQLTPYLNGTLSIPSSPERPSETLAPTEKVTEPEPSTEAQPSETETGETETDASESLPAETEPQNLYGDVNLDGTVNTADVVMLQKVLLGMQKLDKDAAVNGDMNQDGQINGFDLAILKRLVHLM